MTDQDLVETGDALLYFNGINGETGDYDLPPMRPAELGGFIRGEAEPENLLELRVRHQARDQVDMGVKEGVDPKRLDQTGWGVLFASDADPAVKEALTPLLDRRARQVGERFRVYAGADGHRPDESKSAWLGRHKMGPGPADPDKVPYYLLICGDPGRIPFRFQSQLDVQYAVGRIHFDTLDEYANYAASVVAAESGAVRLPRRVQFFGVANPMDQATGLSARLLVEPLRAQLDGQFEGWSFPALMREEATKAALTDLLGGPETPALLFTASHGMEFPLDSARQFPHQGALLCQDWPGPAAHRGAIPPEFYLAGEDLSSDTNLLGLIAFFFACYGGGTPENDEFARQAFKDSRARIAPRPFLSALPKRMLGLPRGGALAAIAHVERAWTYSFKWEKAGAQTEVFRSTLQRLLDGHPVGSAVEFFNERYAELSTVLADTLEEDGWGKAADAYELAGLWTANNDARGYALIGDPAVRLPVAGPADAPAARPTLELRPPLPPVSDAPGSAPAGPGTPGGLATTPGSGADPATDPAAPAGATGVLAAAGGDPGRMITTYTAADPAGCGPRTLVARTRIAPDGSVETLVVTDYADHAALLELHLGTVREVLRSVAVGAPGASS